MGAWIEIGDCLTNSRGLNVAPYMGAWIEISATKTKNILYSVAPYMGAWIEIRKIGNKDTVPIMSLPTWERGLK